MFSWCCSYLPMRIIATKGCCSKTEPAIVWFINSFFLNHWCCHIVTPQTSEV